MSLDYPPCGFCDHAPTTDRTRITERWTDALAFAHGTICSCGDRSEKPPLALKRGDRVFVRVPDSLQNTALGRLEAVRRIPRAWYYRVSGYTFLNEQLHGAYRWWEFQIVYRTVD